MRGQGARLVALVTWIEENDFFLKVVPCAGSYIDRSLPEAVPELRVYITY